MSCPDGAFLRTRRPWEARSKTGRALNGEQISPNAFCPSLFKQRGANVNEEKQAKTSTVLLQETPI